MTTLKAVAPKEIAAALQELWSPRVVGDEECHVMLIGRKTTLHTGDVVTEKTRSIEEQLRPV